MEFRNSNSYKYQVIKLRVKNVYFDLEDLKRKQ